jgi:hypothetical protein
VDDRDLLEIGDVLGPEAAVAVRQRADADVGARVPAVWRIAVRIIVIHSRVTSTLVGRPDPW